MTLTQEQVDGILLKFLAGLDPDEREEIQAPDLEAVNREIGRLRFVDAEDVAEVLWEETPGLSDLEDDHLYDLTDIIEDLL